MSGYVKGTRKPKRRLEIRDIDVGGIKIKPALAIASLMAVLYVIFLVGVKLGSGLDAVLLSVFSLALFAAFAYVVRSGSLSGLKPFTLLIDAFLALSALSMIQAIAGFMNIFGPDAGMAIQHLSLVTAASAAAAALVLMAVLYFEKEGRESIYLKASPLKSAITAFVVMVACGLVTLGLVYFLIGRTAFVLTALNVIAFGLFGGIYEEVLFRGLLLSRLRMVLGENQALMIQAVVFAVFEALAVYTFIPNVLVLPVILIAGALVGFYLGKVTLKNESVLAPQLIHAGLYMLLAVPLLMA